MKRAILVLMLILASIRIIWVNGKKGKYRENEYERIIKREWLLMELKTSLPNKFDNIAIMFRQDLDYPEKVKVIFLHDSDDSYQKLKSLGDKYSRSILTRAKLRQWSWIKVKLVYQNKQDKAKNKITY